MPSYLVTIRYEAENFEMAAERINWMVEHDGGPDKPYACVMAYSGAQCRMADAMVDAPSSEADAAARAFSPAVVEELRQMMESVAENRWDFFTHSEAFRAYIEMKAEEAVRAALKAQLERQRRIP